MKGSQALVAHTCNPSYSGGSEFEASQDKQSMKKPITKKGLVE
jgi:hypothetical protein